MNKIFYTGLFALMLGLSSRAQEPNVLEVDADNIGAEIQPTMYGHFFEDIYIFRSIPVHFPVAYKA